MHIREGVTFHNTLSSIAIAIPTCDQLFLCGDINAPLPVDGFRFENQCGEVNNSTKMLESIVERHDLLPSNAYTRQKCRSLPNFNGLDDRKTRLEYISALYAVDLTSNNSIYDVCSHIIPPSFHRFLHGQ